MQAMLQRVSTNARQCCQRMATNFNRSAIGLTLTQEMLDKSTTKVCNDSQGCLKRPPTQAKLQRVGHSNVSKVEKGWPLIDSLPVRVVERQTISWAVYRSFPYFSSEKCFRSSVKSKICLCLTKEGIVDHYLVLRRIKKRQTFAGFDCTILLPNLHTSFIARNHHSPYSLLH